MYVYVKKKKPRWIHLEGELPFKAVSTAPEKIPSLVRT